MSNARSAAKRQESEIARLTSEIRRHQETAVVQSNALMAVQNELKAGQQRSARLEATLLSHAKAMEGLDVDEVKRQIASFEHVSRSDSDFKGFRPRLAKGCVVDATEFAWVQDASNRLPKEAKPRILIVNQIVGKTVLGHSYCTFQTPRGAWFAYNPTKGSVQLMASQVPNARDWGKELVPSATSAWFEGKPVQ